MVAAQPPVPAAHDASRLFRALADDTRLAVVRMLARTDLKAGEIVRALRAPQSAVSYHLRLLHAAGIVRDRQSSVDARDVYYSLDLDRLQALYVAAGEALHPGILPIPEGDAAPGNNPPLRVLFLCTHNSARSQLAEAILRKIGGELVDASSAGSVAADVHPTTKRLLREMGIDPGRHVSKTLDRFVGQSFDDIITVCDRVRESCPVFPGDPQRIHWSFPDPALVEDPDRQLREFVVIRNELERRINYLLRLPHPATGRRMVSHPDNGPAIHGATNP